jgi:SAM-dependent methyltransferase
MRVEDGYRKPRMAATYDIENAGRADIDFYLRLADSLGARDVIDLGCGTGVLAVELAQSGRRVAGIDPAEAMIDIARRRKGGELVTWIVGTSARMRRSSADLIVMSGHVAQVFVEDPEWAAVLDHAHRALRAGGHLAFEARDPHARAWTAWTRDATEASYAPPGQPPFRSWVAVTTADDGLVTFDAHVAFDDPGEELVARRHSGSAPPTRSRLRWIRRDSALTGYTERGRATRSPRRRTS